jgi:uncharacterized protein YkwD
MRRLTITVLAASALLLALPLAQGEGPADETRITLRDEFLRLINRDRVAHGLDPVQLDPEASAVADNYCRDQIRYRTSGHITIDGLTPYMRYSFAGGNDGLSENAAAWSGNYRFNDRALYDMIVRSERAMMNERAPQDGHRKAILDPFATHVGIGLAWEGGEFRLTQEFIRHYVSWNWPLPRMITVGERVVAAGKPSPPYRVEAISVHHEPVPQSISPAMANTINSYSLPQQRHDYVPRLRTYYERKRGTLYEIREEYADGRKGDFTVATDRSFSFDVPFNDGPGVYTIVIWLRRDGLPQPIAASNISIRVGRPDAQGGYAGAGTR